MGDPLRARLTASSAVTGDLADRAQLARGGYFAAPEIKSCDDRRISAFVPKPMTSNWKAEGRFSKADFAYIARDDEYQCPAGQRLRQHHTSAEDGLRIRIYWTNTCQQCLV